MCLYRNHDPRSDNKASYFYSYVIIFCFCLFVYTLQNVLVFLSVI